jgi:hypothetical protein
MFGRSREHEIYRVYAEDELLDDELGALDDLALDAPEDAHEAAPASARSFRPRASRAGAIAALALVAMALSALATHLLRSAAQGSSGSRSAPAVTASHPGAGAVAVSGAAAPVVPQAARAVDESATAKPAHFVRRSWPAAVGTTARTPVRVSATGIATPTTAVPVQASVDPALAQGETYAAAPASVPEFGFERPAP